MPRPRPAAVRRFADIRCIRSGRTRRVATLLPTLAGGGTRPASDSAVTARGGPSGVTGDPAPPAPPPRPIGGATITGNTMGAAPPTGPGATTGAPASSTAGSARLPGFTRRQFAGQLHFRRSWWREARQLDDGAATAATPLPPGVGWPGGWPGSGSGLGEGFVVVSAGRRPRRRGGSGFVVADGFVVGGRRLSPRTSSCSCRPLPHRVLWSIRWIRMPSVVAAVHSERATNDIAKRVVCPAVVGDFRSQVRDRRSQGRLLHQP